MTVEEMHNEFDITLDKISSSSYQELEPWEKDFYLNEAQMRIIKQRYSGKNTYRKGFEENQKRIDDLKNLVISRFCKVTKVNDPTNPQWGSISTENTYRVDLSTMYAFEVDWNTTVKPRVAIPREEPVYENSQGEWEPEVPNRNKATYEKYMFFVQATANVSNSCGDKYQFVRLIQQNNFEIILKDPFNKPRTDYPVMYFEEGDIYICAGDGKVNDFLLTFIKFPKQMNLGTYSDSDKQDCELSEHMHKEIVQAAATIALENLSSPRVQSQIVLNENKSE